MAQQTGNIKIQNENGETIAEGKVPDDPTGKFTWAYSATSGFVEKEPAVPLIKKEIEAAKKRFEEHQSRIFSMNAMIAMNNAYNKKRGGYKPGREYQ